jgi:hypothetical protein
VWSAMQGESVVWDLASIVSYRDYSVAVHAQVLRRKGHAYAVRCGCHSPELLDLRFTPFPTRHRTSPFHPQHTTMSLLPPSSPDSNSPTLPVSPPCPPSPISVAYRRPRLVSGDLPRKDTPTRPGLSLATRQTSLTNHHQPSGRPLCTIIWVS